MTNLSAALAKLIFMGLIEYCGAFLIPAEVIESSIVFSELFFSMILTLEVLLSVP